MYSLYPLIIVISVALPFFDVVHTKMGECPPTKLLAVNSCAIVSKFSMTPDDDCNNKFGTFRLRSDATQDEIVQDSYRQVCLCDGYKAVASCYQRICPADEQAAFWFQSAQEACATVSANNLTGPSQPATVFVVDNSTGAASKSGADDSQTDVWLSRVISMGSLVTFLLTIAGIF